MGILQRRVLKKILELVLFRQSKSVWNISIFIYEIILKRTWKSWFSKHLIYFTGQKWAWCCQRRLTFAKCISIIPRAPLRSTYYEFWSFCCIVLNMEDPNQGVRNLIEKPSEGMTERGRFLIQILKILLFKD